jgi:two-component system nitrogen regulation response regulator GlnG
MAPAQVIEVKDLPPEIRGASPSGGAGGSSGMISHAGFAGGMGAGLGGSTATGAGAGHDSAIAAFQSEAVPFSAALSRSDQAVQGSGAGAQLGSGAVPSASLAGTFPWGTAVPASNQTGLPGAASAGSGEPAASLSESPGADLPPAWVAQLEKDVSLRLNAQSVEDRLQGDSELMDRLTRLFEAAVIRTALRHTRGRRIDAALRLGIGRNTITRKVQELKLEEGSDLT